MRKENGLNRADACVIMMLGVGFCYLRPFAEPPARRAQTRENSPQKEGAAMKLEWIGHACFRLTAENGTVIVTDP